MKTVSKIKFLLATIIVSIFAFVVGVVIGFGLITHFWETLIILGGSAFLGALFWSACILGVYYEQKKGEGRSNRYTGDD